MSNNNFSVFVLMTGKHNEGTLCFGLIRKNQAKGHIQELNLKKKSKLTFIERVKFMPRLLQYMLPLFIVYYSQYLINQGVSANLKFPNGPMKPEDDYMYYQFMYQTGVFISRSSVNLFQIKSEYKLCDLTNRNLDFSNITSCEFFLFIF